MRRIVYPLLLLTGIFAWPACDLINPEEDIPAYIYLDEFTLTDNPAVSPGSLSQRITNALVSCDGELIGLFSLPATVPILKSGQWEVQIDPCIRENGSASFVNIYPFYKRYTASLDLAPAQTDSVQPLSSYVDNAAIYFIEDFEAGLPIFSEDRDGNTNTSVQTTQDEVFEGNRSGVIHLDTGNIFVDVGTNRMNLYELKDGGIVYLEVDYKSDVQLLFGLIEIDNAGNAVSYYEYGLFPREEWTKVYFNLTPIVNAAAFDAFQVGITAGLPIEGGTFPLKEADIYLDNIKLLSF